MGILIMARQQIRLLARSPLVLVLFTAGAVFLVFILGQAFDALFASTGAPVKAVDYFGTTILTLAVFQGAGIASWGVFKEKRSNTAPRLRLSPLGPLSALYGTLMGSFLALYALALSAMLLCAVLLSVRYGDPLVAALLLSAESLLAASLGVSLATILGEERAATGLMNALVPALVFLGGGYMIIPESGFLHEASRFSPIRWLNLAMLRAAEPGPNPYLVPAIGFCAAASLALIAAASLAARRKK